MIGFIGIGIMGSRMAARLQNAGKALVVYNRTKAKADALVAHGAKWANTPREVGAQADVVFSMLANPQAVEAVAFGNDGLLNGLKPGSIWVDSSTINPATSVKLAQAAAEKGVHFLDAPVAGSTGPAEKGELVFFVGGEEKELEKVRPLLDIMGKAVQYKGKSGSGTAMKLVNNLMLGQAIAAFSEAVAFGESLGLDKKGLIESLFTGPTCAPVLQFKEPKFLKEDFDQADFKVSSIYKDMELASEEAYAHNFALPLSNFVKALYGLIKQQGKGEYDFAAIYSLLKK
ncbi:NAD(P)-dependent oxidoreductase [Sporolactobacillus sp. THM19-2]|jgi:3-hydroxyisobutyrate dehydrogenase-like beta-hydroxyacid dehydrogenase|uniref:NAD(P)-dependent oxidoreductase n=1 Tax=Sporolactobacillus sp. THM19-2 TaxID=2511171 RepID=UPI0010213DEC|nr:NAD(P)-dependent oxidoreductase [Sporolactobacillus sp. THM19-2]RYL88552.1 NAD(P)-dependent oxidoreductase [Sporolactobacillus sp. THM19-2]